MDTSANASSEGGASNGTSSEDMASGEVFFSDNFENDRSSEWEELINGGGSIVVDSTRGAKGTQGSIKIDGASGFHTMIQYLLPDVVRANNQFYGRAYLRVDTEPGTNHYVWIEAGSAVSGSSFQGNDINEMRIGYNLGMLQINHYGGPSGGDQDIRDKNVKLQAGRWHCMQFFMNGDPEEIRVWLDNDETALSTTNFTAQREGSEGNTTALTDWMPPFDAIRFGWELGGATIWYDEIALGTEMMPCE